MAEGDLRLILAVVAVASAFLLTVRRDFSVFFDAETKTLKPFGMAVVALAFAGSVGVAVFSDIGFSKVGAKTTEALAARAGGLEINPPSDPSNVPVKVPLTCKPGPAEGTVYFIVKPVDTDVYTVQELVDVDQGSCIGTVELGRGGGMDVGKTYLVRLVAAPEVALKKNMPLADWPKAKWRSGILSLVRG